MNKLDNAVILACLLGWVYEYPGVRQANLDDELNHISQIVDIQTLKLLLCGKYNQSDVYSDIYKKARHFNGLPHLEEDNDVQKIYPLQSVFDAIELNHFNSNRGVYYPERLGTLKIFPAINSEILDDQLRKSFEQFLNALVGLLKRKPQSFSVLLSHMLAIYEEYLWCFPAVFNQKTDISLFDCARISTAIALTLLKNNSDRIAIIVGDISGIQRYIFGITNIGSGGVAKRLRARSFFLNILSKVIAHRILDAFTLPHVNLIMSAAGKFYILVPYGEISEQLTQIQTELDRWFLDKYNGEITVNLAWGYFALPDLEQFDSVLRRLNSDLDEKKMRPFSHVLCNEIGWKNEFVRPVSPGDTICPACRQSLVKEGMEVCRSCQRDADLGAQLANAQYIAFYRSSEQKYHMIDGYSLNLYKNAGEIRGTPYLVLKINVPDISELSEIQAGFCFIANYIPIETDQFNSPVPMVFDNIAARAKGKKLLGYLKADVDQLGSIFLYGLQRDNDNLSTITRIVGLSRMMELFFAGWLHNLLKSYYPFCYTVFSGGDDLFIVGPWDQILALARNIRNMFDKYVGHNPNLTISAGIALAKPKEPIAQCADRVEDLLDQSKDTCLPGQSSNRNQLTFLNETIKWNDLDAVYKDAEKVATFLQQDVISASLLWKLRHIASLHKDFLYNSNPNGMRYSPLLDYELSKSFSKRNPVNADKHSDASEWFNELRNHLSPKLKHLNFYISYAFLMEGGKING